MKRVDFPDAHKLGEEELLDRLYDKIQKARSMGMSSVVVATKGYSEDLLMWLRIKGYSVSLNIDERYATIRWVG